MAYIAALFLSVAVGFCSGSRADGMAYRTVIAVQQTGTGAYRNEPKWSAQVRRGQQAFLLQGLCPAVSF